MNALSQKIPYVEALSINGSEIVMLHDALKTMLCPYRMSRHIGRHAEDQYSPEPSTHAVRINHVIRTQQPQEEI